LHCVRVDVKLAHKELEPALDCIAATCRRVALRLAKLVDLLLALAAQGVEAHLLDARSLAIDRFSSRSGWKRVRGAVGHG